MKQQTPCNKAGVVMDGSINMSFTPLKQVQIQAGAVYVFAKLNKCTMWSYGFGGLVVYSTPYLFRWHDSVAVDGVIHSFYICNLRSWSRPVDQSQVWVEPGVFPWTIFLWWRPPGCSLYSGSWSPSCSHHCIGKALHPVQTNPRRKKTCHNNSYQCHFIHLTIDSKSTTQHLNKEIILVPILNYLSTWQFCSNNNNNNYAS